MTPKTCLACLLIAVGCLMSPGGQAADREPSISAAFRDDFLVGAALNANQILGGEPGAMRVVNKQFNTVTPENAMKWQSIQPTEGNFDWSVSDALVDYAEQNSMALVGHVLVWHQQVPDWVFENAQGGTASRDVLLQRLETHITTVVERYRGRVHSWEVLNEALNDNGSLRNTPWLEGIGEDYIEKAFEFAHAADPDARLYYNDYNLYLPAKAAGARQLIGQLQAQGIAVHGAGMQGHYDLDSPSDLRQFDAAIRGFGEMGLEVYLTELDLSVLPFPPQQDWGVDLSSNPELNALYNPFEDGLPGATDHRQASRYAKLFRILLANRHYVGRVTFWGVHDGQSWKNYWPINGRTDYPLMFDRQYRPKSAFYRVLSLARPAGSP